MSTLQEAPKPTHGYVYENSSIDSTNGITITPLREFGYTLRAGKIYIDSGTVKVTFNGNWGPFTAKSTDSPYIIPDEWGAVIETIVIKATTGTASVRLNFVPSIPRALTSKFSDELVY